MKKVALGVKPQSHKAPTADEWVTAAPQSPSNGAGKGNSKEVSNGSSNGVKGAITEPQAIPMKRLTIDVPESLHSQIKSACALRGVKMADEIRTLLETHFLSTENE